MPCSSQIERVAANVRAEMARLGCPQTPLATKLYMSQQALSRRLTGQVPFKVHELDAIASLLGVDLAVLMEGAA